MKNDFLELANEFTQFSLKTFKDATAFSSLDKLLDEIKETYQSILFKDKNLPEEYVDCIMCILDSAARAGITPETLLISFKKKLEINKRRTWIKNENNTYSHEKIINLT